MFHMVRFWARMRGQIAEFGSHQELMTEDGLYAELFALQARAYG